MDTFVQSDKGCPKTQHPIDEHKKKYYFYFIPFKILYSIYNIYRLFLSPMLALCVSEKCSLWYVYMDPKGLKLIFKVREEINGIMEIRSSNYDVSL